MLSLRVLPELTCALRRASAMSQSDRVSSPPSTLNRPKRRTFDMCTGGAPGFRMKRSVSELVVGRTVGLSSPSWPLIHTYETWHAEGARWTLRQR
eukprot:3883366-Prymnesium_polylepis.2